jgi:shikimate 5-dehydrogenase
MEYNVILKSVLQNTYIMDETFVNLSEMNPHQTKIIPLIGSPIGGSISPHVHNYLFDLYKVNAMNLPVEIRKRELAGFIEVAKLMNFPDLF